MTAKDLIVEQFSKQYFIGLMSSVGTIYGFGEIIDSLLQFQY